MSVSNGSDLEDEGRKDGKGPFLLTYSSDKTEYEEPCNLRNISQAFSLVKSISKVEDPTKQGDSCDETVSQLDVSLHGHIKYGRDTHPEGK